MRKTRVAAVVVIILAVFVGLRAEAWRQFSRTVYYTEPMLDAVYYDSVARRVAEGHWQQDQAFFMGPAYPYVLGIAYGVFGAKPWVGRAWNLACSLAILALVAYLGKRIGGQGAAIAAAMLWALYRPAVFYEQTLLMEVMAGAMGLGVVALAVAWFDGKRQARPETQRHEESMDNTPAQMRPLPRSAKRVWVGAFLCGVLLGVAALTRANLLAFAPFLAAWILWCNHAAEQLVPLANTAALPPARKTSQAHRRAEVKRRTNKESVGRLPVFALAAVPGIFAAGLVLGIAPASIHNMRAERDFVAITSNAGINLYIGNNAKSRGFFVVPEGINTEQDPRGARVAARALGREGLSSAQVSRWWSERAKEWMLLHPLRFLLNTGHKGLLLFSAKEIPQIYYQEVMREDLPFLRWPLVTFLVIGPLAGVGVVAGLGRAETRKAIVLLLAFVGAQALSLVPFFVTGRYRLPMVPVLCVAGGVGIASLAVACQARAWRRVGELTALGAFLAAGSFAIAALHPALPEQVSQFESMHAALLMKAGQPKEAQAILERRAKDAPTPGVWANLGTLYTSRAETGDLARAAEAYKKAAELSPDDARIWFNLSQVLLRLNRREEARAAVERTLALDPEIQPLAWFNLATLRKLDGDRAGARTAIEEFLRRVPNDAQARALLDGLSKP